MIKTARVIDGTALVTLWVCAALTTQSALFHQHPEILGPAIALDLILSAAAIHWVFGIRRGGLPVWTLSVVLVIGALICAILVPGQGSFVFLLAAGAELVVAGIALARVRKLAATYRSHRADGLDRLDAFERGLGAALESRTLARAVRTEIEIVLLSLLGWALEPQDTEDTAAFTHHRSAGWYPVVGSLIFLSLAEGYVLHLGLRGLGWTSIAWGITLAHVYGVLWLIGDAQALRLQPTRVTESQLRIRVGLRWRCDLHHLDVASAEACRALEGEDLSLCVLGPPNVRVRLRRSIVVGGPFGIERTTRSIALQVDDLPGFLREFSPPSVG